MTKGSAQWVYLHVQKNLIIKFHVTPRPSTHHTFASLPGDLAADAGLHEPVPRAGDGGADTAWALEIDPGAAVAGTDSESATAHSDHQTDADARCVESDDVCGEHDAAVL